MGKPGPRRHCYYAHGHRRHCLIILYRLVHGVIGMRNVKCFARQSNIRAAPLVQVSLRTINQTFSNSHFQLSTSVLLALIFIAHQSLGQTKDLAANTMNYLRFCGKKLTGHLVAFIFWRRASCDAQLQIRHVTIFAKPKMFVPFAKPVPLVINIINDCSLIKNGEDAVSQCEARLLCGDA